MELEKISKPEVILRIWKKSRQLVELERDRRRAVWSKYNSSSKDLSPTFINHNLAINMSAQSYDTDYDIDYDDDCATPPVASPPVRGSPRNH